MNAAFFSLQLLRMAHKRVLPPVILGTELRVAVVTLHAWHDATPSDEASKEEPSG